MEKLSEENMKNIKSSTCDKAEFTKNEATAKLA